MTEIKAEVIRSVEKVDRNEWNNVIEQSKNGDLKQCFQHTKAKERGLPGEWLYFLAKKNENIIGILYGRLRSLPLEKKYLSTQFPIITSEEKAVLEILLEKVESFCKKNGVVYHSITSQDMVNIRYNNLLDEESYKTSIRNCIHILDIDKDLDRIKSGMESSRRRNFEHLSETESVEFLKPSKEDLIKFYEDSRMFQERPEVTERNSHYFQELSELEEVRIGVYREKGEVKGQNLYFLDRQQSCVHYLLSAAKYGYKELNALEAIHSRAIIRFREDFNFYNFGVNRSDFRDGVFRFKDQYGCKTLPKIQWRRVFSSPKNKIYLKLLKALEDE